MNQNCNSCSSYSYTVWLYNISVLFCLFHLVYLKLHQWFWHLPSCRQIWPLLFQSFSLVGVCVQKCFRCSSLKLALCPRPVRLQQHLQNYCYSPWATASLSCSGLLPKGLALWLWALPRHWQVLNPNFAYNSCTVAPSELSEFLFRIPSPEQLCLLMLQAGLVSAWSKLREMQVSLSSQLAGTYPRERIFQTTLCRGSLVPPACKPEQCSSMAAPCLIPVPRMVREQGAGPGTPCQSLRNAPSGGLGLPQLYIMMGGGISTWAGPLPLFFASLDRAVVTRFLPEVKQRGLNNVISENPSERTSLQKRVGQPTPSLSSPADWADAEEVLQLSVTGSSSPGGCPSGQTPLVLVACFCWTLVLLPIHSLLPFSPVWSPKHEGLAFPWISSVILFHRITEP